MRLDSEDSDQSAGENLLARHETHSGAKQHRDTSGLSPGNNGSGDLGEGHTESTPLLADDDAPSQPSTPFLGDISPGRFWIIFSQLLLSSLVYFFDMTILASSHPVITSYFHASHLASWLSTVPMLTSAIVMPLAGRLSDALGRKPLFVGGMVVFTGATAWCALAGSVQSFIAARAASGFGGGIGMCMASILTSDMVKIEYRGSYQAYINITYGIGSVMGAALGGVMAERLGWRWEFGVQVPPLIVLTGITYLFIPGDLGLKERRKTLRETVQTFDSVGAGLLTIFTSFLILGLNLGGNYFPWSHPFIISSLVICAVFGPLFVLAETKVSLPIVPLNILTRSPRSNIFLANFICTIISIGVLFNLPLYFQAVLLTSATTSGLRLVLPMATTSIAGTATGFAINYTGRIKWPVAIGPVFYLIGLISLSLLHRDLHPIVYHLAPIPAFIGQGMQNPGTFMAMLGSSTQDEQAVVTSVVALWRAMGMILGVALSSLAVQNGLLYYLHENVKGEKAEEFIREAISRVESVRSMPEPYREQVVESYAATLRLTFVCGAILSLVAIVVIAPTKMKRLPAKK